MLGSMPERTAQSFFPGDWFRPYDVGYLDQDRAGAWDILNEQSSAARGVALR